MNYVKLFTQSGAGHTAVENIALFADDCDDNLLLPVHVKVDHMLIMRHATEDLHDALFLGAKSGFGAIGVLLHRVIHVVIHRVQRNLDSVF
jgi:hypothetical protein